MNKSEISALVQKAQSGDRSAFETLYNDFFDKVFFFAKRNAGSEQAAEDITSETFAAALEQIGELRSEESFVGWLYSIAYNKCMIHFRQEAKTEHFDTDREMEQALADASLNEPLMLPEDYAVNRDTKEKLKAIIDGLPPKLRSTVILYYYDDMSVSEVSKTLGTGENNTRQRLHKARSVIRKKIEKLIGSGAMFAAVPISALLQNTADASYAAVGTAKVAGTSLAVKLIGIGAAVTVAVGVPIGLSKLEDSMGDYRPNEITVSESERKDSGSSSDGSDVSKTDSINADRSRDQIVRSQYDNITVAEDFKLSVPDHSELGVYEVICAKDFDKQSENLFSKFIPGYDKSKVVKRAEENGKNVVIFEDENVYSFVSSTGGFAVSDKSCLNKVMYGNSIYFNSTDIADIAADAEYEIGGVKTSMGELVSASNKVISDFIETAHFPNRIKPFSFSVQTLDDGKTAGIMHCRSTYKGIPIFDLHSENDELNEKPALLTPTTCTFVNGSTVGQFANICTFLDHKTVRQTDKIVSPEEAVDLTSKKLSRYMKLKLQYEELVYFPNCTGNISGSGGDGSEPGDIITLTPYWVIYFNVDWWHEVFAVVNAETGEVGFVNNTV